MTRMLRWICLLLAALVPVTALAAQGGEDFRLHGYVYGTLKFESGYLEPHLGPGYKYDRAGLDLAAGAQVKVLTQAADPYGNRWVLVEAEENRRARRVYLLQQERGGQALITCDLSKVPTEPAEMESAWQCMCYEEVNLRYGPGSGYAATGFTIRHETNAWVVLTNNGWALVECTDAYDDNAPDIPYFTRGWVDFENLIY